MKPHFFGEVTGDDLRLTSLIDTLAPAVLGRKRMDKLIMNARGIRSKHLICMLTPDFCSGIGSRFYYQITRGSTTLAHKNLPGCFVKRKKALISGLG